MKNFDEKPAQPIRELKYLHDNVGLFIFTEMKRQDVKLIELTKRVGNVESSSIGRMLRNYNMRTDQLRRFSIALGVDFFYHLSVDGPLLEVRLSEKDAEIAKLRQDIEALKQALQKKDFEIEKNEAVIAALKEVRMG